MSAIPVPVETEASESRTFWGITLLFLVAIMLMEPGDMFFSSYPEVTPEENADVSQSVDLPRRVGLLLLGGFGLYSLRRKTLNRVCLSGVLPWFVILFMGWSLLSYVWADEPGTALRKVISLTLAGLGALGVAKTLSMENIARLILIGSTIYCGRGFVGEVLCGTFRPYQGEYRFQGVNHVAFTAWCLSLMFMTSVLLLRTARSHRRLLQTLAATALIFLILTKTRASVAAFVVGLVCYYAVAWPWKRFLVIAYSVGVTALFGCWLLQMATGDARPTLTTMINLGREKGSASELTGRKEIWEELIPYLKARLWQGYGYGSFWTRPRLMAFGESQGWAVPDSHNTYIDLTLGVGLVGVLLYLLILVGSAWRATACYRRDGDQGFALVVAGVMITAVNGTCVAAGLSLYQCTVLTFILLLRVAFIQGPPFSNGSQESGIRSQEPEPAP